MRLLDLFCCAGGAGEGYKWAGFEVVGVDINPQPNNPHTFVCADALEFVEEFAHEFDAVHASPPCQAYTKAGKQWRKAGKVYPDLISKTREALIQTGLPWVIENVPGAPLQNPVILNGSVFGINIHKPRYFESSFFMPQPDVPKMSPVKMGRPIKDGDVLQPIGHFSGVAYARKEMRLPWMTQGELAQAIPPVYTEWVGGWMLQEINATPGGIDVGDSAEGIVETISDSRKHENKQTPKIGEGE